MTYRQPRMGASMTPEGISFRVWAPKATTVEIAPDSGDPVPMTRDGEEFHAIVSGLSDGFRYKYLIDGTSTAPDPYARYLPDGVHGSAEVLGKAPSIGLTIHGPD